MQTDQKFQSKQLKFLATVDGGKLLLEVNDHVTYKGEIESSPYYDINQLKTIFQMGEVQIVIKTTSKMTIKLGFLKIQLLSQENRQILELKKKVEELENKLQNQGKWEIENLDSKENFDVNYIYRLDTSGGGLNCPCTSTTTANLFFFGSNGSCYNVANSNRKTCSAGWTITKILKKKI